MIVVRSELGVLLARRTSGACAGLWNLPGGTVRFAEPLSEAIHRVALDEIAAEVVIDNLLGYVEYPSHLRQGIDWPVGIVFETHLDTWEGHVVSTVPNRLEWFVELPHEMHEEDSSFLRAHHLAD
jgi:ADP-ribose pyrophosphatase YjhB (NUDIX family)